MAPKGTAPSSIQAAYEQQMRGEAAGEPATGAQASEDPSTSDWKAEQESRTTSTGGGPEPSGSAGGQASRDSEPGDAPPEEGGSSSQSAPGSSSSPSASSSSKKPEPYILDGIDLSEYELPPEALEAIKKGTLRNADYTRKTQAVAELRKKAEELDTFKTYLADNPHVLQAIRDASANRREVDQAQEPQPPSKPLEEMTPEEQMQFLEQSLGSRIAKRFIEPFQAEIRTLREELQQRDAMSQEDRELLDAYFPGEPRLPDTEEIQQVNDLRGKVPHLSKRQLYEMVMAPTWQEQALKAASRQNGNTARRAAASVSRPGNAAAQEAVPDVRKAKSSKSAWGEASNFALRKHGLI